MESRAKLFGHPIHQMLIVFPLGLLAMAAIFDVLAMVRQTGYWSEIAYWMIAAGVITGLVAAPFGFIDWLAIPRETRAKRIGALLPSSQHHRSGAVRFLLHFQHPVIGLEGNDFETCDLHRGGRLSQGGIGHCGPQAGAQPLQVLGRYVTPRDVGQSRRAGAARDHSQRRNFLRCCRL